MPGGLVALLDDVSVIAKAAAATIDDVGVAASKAGSKTAGVIIDDAAVTPSYVTGFTPDRELPIIYAITKGSLINKLLILLPAALLLSVFLPWAITPILMLGGLYLTYEGAEKVTEMLGGAKHGETLADPIEDFAQFEDDRVKGAIRTDLILSAEIMAITLAQVASETLITRVGVLAVVGIGVTFVVYGAVAVIVKIDDIGLHLARKPSALAKSIGALLLAGMPKLLAALSFIGTIAMLWVGGGIVLHGMEDLGFHLPADVSHTIQHWVSGAAGSLGGALGWLSGAFFSGVFGLLLGAAAVFVLHKVLKIGHEEAAH